MKRLWQNPKARRWLIRAGIVLTSYALVGFFLLPWILRSQLLRHLPELTRRPAAVREVRFNPFTLALTIRGLSLTETNGQPFASFEEFHANFQLSSLFRLAWTFDTLRLDSPRLEIALGPDGRLNFANILEPAPGSPTPAPPPPDPAAPPAIPRVTVFHLVVTNGAVGFTDASRKSPFRTAYQPIHLNLSRFTTKPDRSSPYAFEAFSDTGRGIRWAGTVTAQPPASSGSLEIDGFQLPKHNPYVEDFTRGRIADGELDIAAGYRFALGTNGTDLTVSNLTVTLSRLRLHAPGSEEPLLSLPSSTVADTSLDLRSRLVRVGRILVSEPSTLVRRRPDGSWNFEDLLPENPPPSTPSTPTPPPPDPSTAPAQTPPWTIEVQDAQLLRGSVRFEDQSVNPPFNAALESITVQVRDFSTAEGREARLDVGLVTDAAETFSLTARGGINPIRSAGTVDLASLHLPRYQPYVQPHFLGRLASGKSEVHLTFTQSLDNNGQLAFNASEGSFGITDLQITDPSGDRTHLRLPAFAITGASASLLDKTARIASIQLSNTVVAARREADGSLDVLRLLPGPATNPPSAVTPETTTAPNHASAPDAPPAAGWSFALDELAFLQGRILAEDHALPRPGQLEIGPLDLTVRGARFPSNAPVTVELTTAINQSASAHLTATVLPGTPSADAELQLNSLQLAGFEPWLQSHLNLALPTGAFHAHLRASYGAPDQKLKLTGSLGITNLVAVETVSSNELVRWSEWAVDDIDAGVDPMRVKVGRIRWADLAASVVLNTNGQPNVLAVLPTPPNPNPNITATTATPAAPDPEPAPDTPPSPETASPDTPTTDATTTADATTTPAPAPASDPRPAGTPVPFPVEVGEVRLERTALHFEDRSLPTPCVFDLKQLDAVVEGISSDPAHPARVTVSGLLDDGAPFGLHGTIHPLAASPSLDLTLTNRNFQLTPFSPYMEKFAGYPINRGRLSLDLQYFLQDNALGATNKVRLDQFTLGARTDSPDATQLPVKLAISLLKDVNGVIDLDVPVKGRLDDPQFRIGPIVSQIIGNLITKIASSPFKLLGSLVGGGGDELSFIEFVPGTLVPAAGETNKLAKLVEALDKRPALSLEIQGSTDPAADRDALAVRKVRQEILARHSEELAVIAGASAAPETTPPTLDPADRERLLRAAVVQAGLTNLTEALQDIQARRAAAATNAAAATAAERARRGPGPWQLITGIFRPSQERAALRQARRAAKADEALLEQNPALAQLGADDMESLLASKTDVPPDALAQLAQDRAKAVQELLLAPGRIDADRLLLARPRPTSTNAPPAAGSARVTLTLD